MNRQHDVEQKLLKRLYDSSNDRYKRLKKIESMLNAVENRYLLSILKCRQETEDGLYQIISDIKIKIQEEILNTTKEMDEINKYIERDKNE